MHIIKGKIKYNKEKGKSEEKRTDVNVAINMLHDAVENRYDTAVLISNDSDFIPVIEMVKYKYQKDVLVVRPILNDMREGRRSGAGCDEIAQITRVKDIDRPGVIQASQYPDLIMHEGREIKKPDGW